MIPSPRIENCLEDVVTAYREKKSSIFKRDDSLESMAAVSLRLDQYFGPSNTNN
jgi:hypothetical protein